MFIEPSRSGRKKGWMEVICGCMFSGKTEELIRRLKRVQRAGQKVEIFKPAAARHYDHTNIVSHDATWVSSTLVENHYNILLLTDDVDVVGIDEAHFFQEGIAEVVEDLILMGIRVIIAGLDMDHTGKPFGPVPALLARAEFITKLHAICARCGDNANYSYLKPKTEGRVLTDAHDLYEPRCRQCFYDF